MRLISRLLFFVLLISLFIASERHAWAYVDPGSGLFALQGLASISAAITYFLRRRLLALFGRGKTARKFRDPKHDSSSTA